ncbi:hypothetical protein MMC07_003188 [Pseudocyphellaria aurata]|nr:hypothetical protein [Pseudocyphellaria aurata]
MPQTHGRPRDKGGTDSRNATAKEFESSNSTMNRFLGGTPKSWMMGNQVTPNQVARNANRRPDAKPTPPINVVNQTSEAPPSPHAASNHQVNIDHRSNPGSHSGESPASRSPIATNTINGPTVLSKNIEPTALLENIEPTVDAVLPSPAPSDEPRQESVHVIDLDDEPEQVRQVEQHPSDQPDVEPSTSRLNELAEKYGGVDELEKRLRGTESSNTSYVSFSTGAPPEATPNSSTVNARKRMQDMEGISRKRFLPVQRFVPDTSLQTPSTRDTARAEPALAATSEATPSNAVMNSFLAKITHRVETTGNHRGKSIEIPRLGLLQDACNCQDYFYLILHQLFCVGPNRQAINHGTAFGLTEEHVGGLMLLTHLLLPNDQLNDESMNWFSTFPLPMESLLQWSSLKRTYECVRTCLAKLPQCWLQVRNHCQRRYYPPLVDEMIDTLGVQSAVLQRVISRAILRDIWHGVHDDCYLEGESLFCKNQQDVQSRARTPHELTQTKIVAYNQSLAIEYQRLWAKHQRHAQQTVRTQQMTLQGGSRTQMFNTSMAPPQQIHTTFPSPRNNTFPHGLSRSASDASRPQPALSLNINAQDNSHRFMNSLDRSRRLSSSPTAGAHLNPFSNGIPVSTQLNPFPSRSSSITSYSPISPLQRAGPSDLWTPQQIQASSMTLGSNVSENALTPPNYAHGMHQRESSNTSRHPRHPFHSTEGVVESPGLETLQSATGSPATALAGRIGSPQFSIQNMRLPRSSTFPLHTQRENPMNPGYSNPFVPTVPNAPQSGIGPTATQYSNGRAFVPQQLLPARGQRRQTTDPPNPGTSALHQVEARSPNFLSLENGGRPGAMLDSFAFVKRLTVMPNRLDEKKRSFKWTFEVTKEEFDLFARETDSSDGAPPVKLVRTGSQLCRIRCVKVPGENVLSEVDWVVSDTVWPNGVAMLLNGTALEIRKKVHHGKDLPIDVTKELRRDENVLSIATTRPRQNDDFSYEVGLETIQIIDSAKITNEVVKLQTPDALDRILNHSKSNDPEVQVVDATILLDLTDPYTSRIFDIPVRGRACRHNQCFDLYVFLQTRGRKSPNHPAAPESFKCPICGADARPQSLVMDLFFLKIRTELQVINRVDVKAVTLGEQGNWDIKEEEEAVGEPGDGSGKRVSRASDARAGNSLLPNDSEVIEIDDD